MSPPPPGDRVQRHFSTAEILALYPNLRADRLRCLERWRLIRPADRDGESYFAFSDLAVVRQASADLARGVPFRGVLRWIQAARDGQLALDFRSDQRSAELASLPGPVPPGAVSQTVDPSAAEREFERALALDDGDPRRRDDAARLYRRALEADPSCAPALVNLANIHHARGELAEAEALYERAIVLDARMVEAYFNLGNLHYDLDRLERARVCYEQAVATHAAFADAHFYLAVTLERLGRSDDARPHWRAYQNLVPDGEWAALAREFSE
jgi:tetratricopeptide (TPR) repeat protein